MCAFGLHAPGGSCRVARDRFVIWGSSSTGSVPTKDPELAPRTCPLLSTPVSPLRMSHKREKYVPKHRQAKHRKETAPFIKVAPAQVLRSTAVFSSVAVAATAGVVSTGVASSPLSVSSAAESFSDATKPLISGADRDERAATVS